MGKVDLKEIFLDLQNQMAEKLSTNKRAILNPGAKGEASEINWIEWLHTYLPSRYHVGKACIIDSRGSLSEQIDAVIYDQQYTPFVFNQDGAKYIPAEGVYAVFEVKQKLDKWNIEYAGQKAESVRNLFRTSAPIPHVGGISEPKALTPILAGILTLSSCWKPPLGTSFEKHIKNLNVNQRLNLGCSLQSGSFKINYSDTITFEKSNIEESFIFFFLKLLMELQKLATVPAIDILSYATALESF